MPRPFVPQRRPPESNVKAKRQGSLLQVRTWSLHSTAYKRGPRTMRAFAFYSPKVTGEQRNSFGSRAFSGTLNGCLLIGGFPGGVYTGLREFERYMAICGGMGGWNVFVLGSGSLEPGARGMRPAPFMGTGPHAAGKTSQAQAPDWVTQQRR